MSSGILRLSDVIVADLFTPITQRQTMEKMAIIESGAAMADPLLDNFLAGEGLTVTVRKSNPIDPNDVENTSSDDPTVHSTPNKPSMGSEKAVRLSRNNSWSSMDLVRALLSKDPVDALAGEVSTYWARRRQRCIIAMMTGIFANNALPSDAYHRQNDMTVNLSTLNGGVFADGATNFHGGAFIDAFVTLGDAMGQVNLVLMHSVVYATALKQNLIQFRLASDLVTQIPTYMGKDVVMDDGMPSANGVFETWLFGAGAIGMGTGTPEVANEVLRIPSAGNGGGQEIMWDRVEWAHHVPGYSYIGDSPAGGPSNAATTGNLANASSWRRAAPERKQVPIARLVTREF